MSKKTFLFLFLTLPVIASAEIYKWTDENGRVHFSDKPVNKSAKEVQLQQQNISTSSENSQMESTPLTDEQRRANQSRLGNSLEVDRIKREQIEANEKKEKQRREQNCRYAKRNLKAAKEVGSVFSYDDQGNKYHYNKQQRQAYIQRRIDQVNKWCD